MATTIQRTRFQSNSPEYPAGWVFRSATVQYFETIENVRIAKGSSIAAMFCRSRFDSSPAETPQPVSSNSAPTNEAISLRANTAIAKMNAAQIMVFGTANNRMALKCADHNTGPQRSGSTQGMYLPTRMPMETPIEGIIEMRTAPRKRPTRKSKRRNGVEI